MDVVLSKNEMIKLEETLSLLGVNSKKMKITSEVGVLAFGVDDKVIDIDEEDLSSALSYINEVISTLFPMINSLIEFMENDDNSVQIMMDYIKMAIGVDFEEVMDKLVSLKKKHIETLAS